MSDKHYRYIATFTCQVNATAEEAVVKACVLAPTKGLAYIEAGQFCKKLAPDLHGVLTDIRVVEI